MTAYTFNGKVCEQCSACDCGANFCHCAYRNLPIQDNAWTYGCGCEHRGLIHSATELDKTWIETQDCPACYEAKGGIYVTYNGAPWE